MSKKKSSSKPAATTGAKQHNTRGSSDSSSDKGKAAQSHAITGLKGAQQPSTQKTEGRQDKKK